MDVEDIHSINAAKRLDVPLCSFLEVFNGPDSDLRKKYKEVRDDVKRNYYQQIYLQGNR